MMSDFPEVLNFQLVFTQNAIGSSVASAGFPHLWLFPGKRVDKYKLNSEYPPRTFLGMDSLYNRIQTYTTLEDVNGTIDMKVEMY